MQKGVHREDLGGGARGRIRLVIGEWLAGLAERTSAYRRRRQGRAERSHGRDVGGAGCCYVNTGQPGLWVVRQAEVEEEEGKR